jgi:hypothetical protein
MPVLTGTLVDLVLPHVRHLSSLCRQFGVRTQDYAKSIDLIDIFHDGANLLIERFESNRVDILSTVG